MSPLGYFLITRDEYSALFKETGFKVERSWIDKVVTYHSAEEAYRIFESGAAAGYLNQEYYSVPISQEYIEEFRKVVRKSFDEQAGETGKVKLIFYRIYLLAIKE